MTVWLVLILAGVTYASRAAAMVVMPEPREKLRRVLDRVPAPLFAALAAVSLIEPGGRSVPVPTLAAAVGGALLAPTRSLLAVLAGGLVGYGLASVIG